MNGGWAAEGSLDEVAMSLRNSRSGEVASHSVFEIFWDVYMYIYIYFFKFFNNLFDLSCGYGGCAFSDKYSLAQKSYDECYNVEIERTLRIDRVISEILILPKIINSVYFSIFVRRLKIYHIVSCSYKILSTIVNTNYWK